MGKKELKEQNKDLVIHVVDVINKFDPSNSSKFTGFLIKKLKEHLDIKKSMLGKPSFRGRLREVILEGRNSNIKNFSEPIGDNDLEKTIIYYLTDCYGRENLESLHMFNEHLKNIFTTRYLRQISHLSFEQFPFLCSNNYLNCPKYNLNLCSKTEPVTFRADATGHMSGSGLRIRIHFLRIRIQ